MSTTPLHYENFDAHAPYADTGPYRAADYWQLPEGEPIELVRGRFMMSPSPTPYHQSLVVLLTEMLSGIARQSGGLVYCAPMDVVLADDTILQPDLLYIAKDRCDIVQNRIEGPPDLVIEILSDGTERRDRLEKLDLYAFHQVAEYWIVDPRARLFEFLINEQGRYVVMPQGKGHYQSPRLPEIAIEIMPFWQEVDKRLPKKS
jgi:Uma2 family endonuclease